MSKLETITGFWLIRGGSSPLPLWPSLSTRIPVKDESEPAEHAEIAWGKDRNTGKWCASIYFGDIAESPFISKGEDDG